LADAHYKKDNKNLVAFLEEILKNPPSQIFLMGDIFHLLLPFKFLEDYNQKPINLINELSKITEVYYTPGNHDFNLNKIFPNVKIADAFVDEKKSIFLTHGDLTDKDLLYKIYVRLIRNSFGNKILNFLSFNFINQWLFKLILRKKVKCLKIFDFEANISRKIADINYKTIIEGHYHQDGFFKLKGKKYYALASFYCSGKYYKFEQNAIKGYKWKIRH